MRAMVTFLSLACSGALLFAACVDGTTPDCSPGSGCEPSPGVDSGPLVDSGVDGDTGTADTFKPDQSAADTSVADAPPG